jgi:serine/threonine-protein kinase
MSTNGVTKKFDRNEPFELLELLGYGGFAQTYKARVLDEQIRNDFGEEIIALKIPLADKVRSLKRDLEMQSLLHLRLRDLEALNLVRYLGFDMFEGKIVLAFEYITGGSLRDRIGRIGHQKPLPVAEALGFADGILQGLRVIHNEHIFHRDIKPENILLQDDVAKIADLGISRMVNANEYTTSISGTINYMAPEVTSTRKATFTADIWSLGVTLYEMLTGRLPFGKVDAPIAEQVDLIRNLRQTPACDVCSEVPVSVSDVIEKALSKNPKDRFTSAEEMLEALRCVACSPDDRFEMDLAKIKDMIAKTFNTPKIESKLHELVKSHSQNERAYQHLGEFYNRCQRYQESVRVFKKGLKIKSDSAMLRWDLALAYQKLGKKNGAIQNIKKAIALGLEPALHRHAQILLNILREKP